MKKIAERIKSLISSVKTNWLRNEGGERLGICFAAIIMLFFVANIIVPDKDFSAQENRELQKFPKLSVSEYTSGRFETKLENYVNDQFVLRNVFVRLKSAIDVSAGSVNSNDVWKGKDGYLMEDVVVPDNKVIDADIKALTAFKKKYKKMPMHFLLAPTAVNIYSDMLPNGVTTEDQNKYIDMFYEKLGTTGIEAVDVRKELQAALSDNQLFYKTDHHWTTDGAKVAFDKYAKTVGLAEKNWELYEVKSDFVGSLASKSGFASGSADVIKLATAEDGLNSVIYYPDSKEKTTEYYNLKNLKKKDAYTVFSDGNHPIYTIKTPTAQNRRLLLVKDSYANSMIPFLAQYYREIVVVDPRYYFDNIEIMMMSEDISEVLFLYNANTFFGEDALSLMLSDAE